MKPNGVVTECNISAGVPDREGDSFDYEAPVCK